jgi:hypothetical protein
VRRLVLLAAVLVAAGCGSQKADVYAQANTALLAALPVYPGASLPKTSSGSGAGTEFAARDWTLPAHTNPETVIDWYVAKLHASGWKIVGKYEGTLRAFRGEASVSVGARIGILEAVVNAHAKP